jgi:selenocysteine lyase/cysteine desulfurase
MPDARVRRRITRRETIEELRHDRETPTLDLEHPGTTVGWRRVPERRKTTMLRVRAQGMYRVPERRKIIRELHRDPETTTLDLEHQGMTVEWRRAQEHQKIIRLRVVKMNRATMLRDETFHVLLLRSRSGRRLRLNSNGEIPR